MQPGAGRGSCDLPATGWSPCALRGPRGFGGPLISRFCCEVGGAPPGPVEPSASLCWPPATPAPRPSPSSLPFPTEVECRPFKVIPPKGPLQLSVLSRTHSCPPPTDCYQGWGRAETLPPGVLSTQLPIGLAPSQPIASAFLPQCPGTGGGLRLCSLHALSPSFHAGLWSRPTDKTGNLVHREGETPRSSLTLEG